MKKVGIIDCGVSNLTSVQNALDYLGIDNAVIHAPQSMNEFSHLVLPGVGAFRRGMQNLHASGLDEALIDEAHKGKPIIGLCLGMQLIAQSSAEFGATAGLGLIPGEVVKLQVPPDSQYRLPHVGWNEVAQVRPSALWRDIEDHACFYFVHSYVYGAIPNETVIGTCDYGTPMVAVIEHGNIVGAQFHPEKSQKAGLQLLRNFVELC